MSKSQKKERIKYLWDLVREHIKRSKFLFRAKVELDQNEFNNFLKDTEWQEGNVKEVVLDADLNRQDTAEI